MDLERALRDKGTARIEVTPDRSVYQCRQVLIEAAKSADVRISMKRVFEKDPTFELVVATVLSPEEAQRQVDRVMIFAAVNDLRAIADEVNQKAHRDDLHDISDELEEYARKLSSGAKEASPFPSDAAPALEGESK
jgi:hypothetical protein